MEALTAGNREVVQCWKRCVQAKAAVEVISLLNISHTVYFPQIKHMKSLSIQAEQKEAKCQAIMLTFSNFRSLSAL